MANGREMTQQPDPMPAPQQKPDGMLGVTASREAQQVMMQMAMAKRFPRNEVAALDQILNECTRASLAERAVYEYPRGGEKVTGPSIRLAEVLARHWGNMEYGLRELEQRVGGSTVEAYCLDLETNVRVARTFEVAHVRHTRKGKYDLDDPRDIYELTANQGQRRVRACILEQIPGDIVDQAVARCTETLSASVNITPELLTRMVEEFQGLGVTQAQLEAHISRHLDAITPGQVLQLRRIADSIRDGIAPVESYFPPLAAGEVETAQAQGGMAGLKSQLKSQQPQQAAPQAQAQDQAAQQQDDRQATAEPTQIPVPEKMGRSGAVQQDWTQWGNRMVGAIMAAEQATAVGQWLDVNQAAFEKAPQKTQTRIEEAARERVEALTETPAAE